MHCFFLVTVLSLHVGYSLRNSDTSSSKYGSHNLLKLERNNSVHRSVRCTPCEQDTNLKRPVSNHLDPEYRGNGADNLGYDWSPMAWGGPAFPRRMKFNVGGMRGRDGRMMMSGEERSQGNVQIICDTCRAYWTRDRGDGSTGRDSSRGRQYNLPESPNYYGSQPGYWDGGKMTPEDYEARVMSPTVGVLVKPGSRIAYIPSRSGEMYWDGVSGGGTRWDGFSNGISWIGNGNSQEWDRSDSESRSGPDSQRPESDFSYSSNSYGSWNNQKRPNWGDNAGRDYYFTNGVPNDIDPQWRDRGYASNWHYGSTNQNGWNGNNMKWNYGGKQWSDNDRAANRFYFNTPQDRTYGPTDGQRHQYGNQYSNYQPTTVYPPNFRPHPPWPAGGGYRPNDRFPADFHQGNYDKNKPWDYTSRDPFGYRRPGQRPEWARPGQRYPSTGNNVDNYDKFPGYHGGHDKFSSPDKSDYEKPWNKPSDHGFSKPGVSGVFPYGGSRIPEDGGDSRRPGYPITGGHLFVPNDGSSQPGYSGVGSGESRPHYSSGNGKPGEYPISGNKIGTHPDVGRPSVEPSRNKRPLVIYTGERPSGVGSSSGAYPSGESSSGYPGGGSLSGGYPGGGSPSGGYPGGGSPLGGYPGSGSPSGGYPGSGSPSGGYPGSGSPSGGYPGGERPSGGYPGGGSFSGGYPGGGSPSGGYPGGGSPSGGYPGSGSPSGGYQSTGNSVKGYPVGGGFPAYTGGGRPSGYSEPASGGPSYPSGISRPDGYFTGSSYHEGGSRPGSFTGSGSRPDKYYGGSSGAYPNEGGFSYPQPSVYPSGGDSSYPSGGSRPGFYPNDGYPSSALAGGSQPTSYPKTGRPGQLYPGENNRPDGYYSGNRPNYSIRGPSSYPGAGLGGSKPPPKGYYTGFITEINEDDRQSQYGGKYPNYFGGIYPGDKNRDKYYNEGSYSNGYPSADKNRFPGYSEDRYSGGNRGGSYPAGSNDRGSDKFYYGQSDGNNKYSGGFSSNHRYPSGGGDDYDRNQSSSSDKNSWNYGQNERKDGIYRRSGGSYPSYRGGQYYTSSYLASMSTTAGSTQAGTEPKTQSVTKADEVTQATSDSS